MSTESLPRLLPGVGDQPTAELACHLELHGPLPDLKRSAPAQLIEQIERAGLRGHGGAAFPAARKLRAVAGRRGAKVVLVNGAEGEPASKKDRVLLREVPHLVLDGAAVAARTVGAREAVIAAGEHDERSARSLTLAIRERRSARLRGEPHFSLIPTPQRYLAGQEMALINLVNTGIPKPTFVAHRPHERGVRQRPTLVQNVETLAHMALIARHGGDWFRQVGTAEDPGTALITLSGAVQRPGVYEIEHGMELSELFRIAGADTGLRAVLLGGYFGSWLSAADVPAVRLANRELARYGASLGAGVIVALGPAACPVAETARVADYFAAEGAGQCGPCVNGLAAIADTIQRLSSGTAPRSAHDDLERWATELPGRGACGHPDGAVRFVLSALRVFAEDFQWHSEHGRCARCLHPPVLPTISVPRAHPLAA